MATGGRTFTSAAQSQYQLILRNEAKATGISIDALSELLAVTNADPDLIVFPTACESILWVCHVIKRAWKAEPSSWGLHRWVKVARWVVLSRKKLASAIGGSFDSQGEAAGESETRNAMIGNGVDRHPRMPVAWWRGEHALSSRSRRHPSIHPNLECAAFPITPGSGTVKTAGVGTAESGVYGAHCRQVFGRAVKGVAVLAIDVARRHASPIAIRVNH